MAEHVAEFEVLGPWSLETSRRFWEGFTAPIVTGLIAARMARSGESAREAGAALLAKARTIPGVGRVLLPCCDDDEHCGHFGDGARCGCAGGCACADMCGCGQPRSRTR